MTSEPFYKVSYKDLLTITCGMCDGVGSHYARAELAAIADEEWFLLVDAIPRGQEFFGEKLEDRWGRILKCAQVRVREKRFNSGADAVEYANKHLGIFKRLFEGEPVNGMCLKCGMAITIVRHDCEPCDSAPHTVDTIIAEREKTHGDYEKTMKLAISLSRGTEAELFSAPIDSRHVDAIASTLRMICMKLARIACGDPTFIDHWNDIGGYAKKMAELLKGKTK